MRVVGGTARGRRLLAPSGGTRPTSDRVREAVFSMLASMGLPGDAHVLDLFAGSGALGIESVSRGARSAVLVDSGADAVAVIRSNSRVLGERSGDVRVVRSGATAYLAGCAERFDLVFADPPYSYGGWGELLALLRAVLAPSGGVLVAETGGPWEPGPAWETVKARSYGGTVVSIAQPADTDPVPVAEEGES